MKRVRSALANLGYTRPVVALMILVMLAMVLIFVAVNLVALSTLTTR